MLASIFHAEVTKWNENNHSESSENNNLLIEQNSIILKIPDLSDDIFREEKENDHLNDCF